LYRDFYFVIFFKFVVENDYQQDACGPVIEKLLDCCESNEDKNFPSCDGFKFMLNKRKAKKAEQKKSASKSN
jgi:hypothetical protein